MTRRNTRRQHARRGGAMVELAVALPLLVLLTLGAVDFGRLFFAGVVAANAAHAGVFFGAQNTIAAGDFDMMESSAIADAAAEDIGVSAAADQFCQCPDGTEVACSDIEVTTCPGYGTPRAYVRVRTTGVFETFGAYPWIPGSTPMGRRVWMRVR